MTQRTLEHIVERSPEQHGWHVPRFIVVCVGLAILLPVITLIFGLTERVQHVGNLLHFLEALLFAFTFGSLLLGWRDRERVDLTDELAALMTMFAGLTFGMLWKVVEFVLDWVRYSDIQKSNADTMTDLLWNDVGAVVGAVLATRAYRRWLASRQQKELGDLGVWLTEGPSRVLGRHGLLITVAVAMVMAAAVAGVWFAGRPLPGILTS